MLKTFLIALSFLGLPTFANELRWKDGNGVEWQALPIRSNFYRTQDHCRALGMYLPSSADLLDAIEYGLFNPSKNPQFGKEIQGYDWMWVRDLGILGARKMVSKQGDTTYDEWSERHFGICAKY